MVLPISLTLAAREHLPASLVAQLPLAEVAPLQLDRDALGRLCLKEQGRVVLVLDWSQRLAQLKAQVRPTQELVARALGRRLGAGQEVSDLTCGLGGDSLLLLLCGFTVRAYERHPVVYALLWDAWQRVLQTPWADLFAEHFSLHFGPWQQVTRLFYYDPMFAPPKRRALPKKEMQCFEKLVGRDEDQEQVLTQLLASGAQRIVIKRPLRAPLLLAGPRHQVCGKAVRFDVYGHF